MASENDLQDSEDVKKKALARLAVAGLVTAAALAGLWWLDQGKQVPVEKAAPAPQPAPIKPAPTPEPALPQTKAEAETPGEPLPREAPSEADVPREAPPPPHISNEPHPIPTPAKPSPIRQAAPSPAQPGHAALPPTAPTGSFVVQLGVFTTPARAEELVRQLKAKGIRASTETRVHVGPFLNREEAEKAQAEMQRLGIQGVVTTVAATK
jgi:DedD protein